MDLSFQIGILFLLGCQLELPQLCTSQTCSYGDVRLVNGAGPHEGRVEICRYNGVWKTVCDDSWSYLDAKVVCAQLHYPPEDALALSRAAFGQGNGSIIETLSCRGSELRVADCSMSDYTDSYRCTHSEDAGVRCLSCNSHGALRLRGGSSQYTYRNYGRVEICVNGVWGTVCDNYWDSTDARVVCRQLGYSRFNSLAYSQATYGRGRGPIYLVYVRCTGSERRLIDCTYTNNTLGRYCSHSEDASVYCQSNVQCQEGALRLADNTTLNRGRVEICVNETWGTICSTNWGQSDATVTCRQLGFSVVHGATAQSLLYYGTRSVHYSSVQCTGRELWLTSCRHYVSTGSCYSSYRAGVHCSLDYLPSPMRLQVTCEESNWCTLNWQSPTTSSSRYGNILNYFVNCSTMGATREDHTTYITRSTYATLWLQPYQFYNCCVAAVNEAGRGNSSCQTIVTHEAAPTASPTNTEAYQFNSTSVFLSWSPPLAQYQNGIIRGYFVEFSYVNSTEAWLQYTNQDQHLLIDNLQPNALYAYRVAAYTIGRGPFSEPFMILLNSESGEDSQSLGDGTTTTTATTVATLSALLVVVIITAGICFTVPIIYKLATKKKRCPVHNVHHLYETVNDPKPTQPVKITLKERSIHTCAATRNEHDYRDGSLTPPLPPRAYSLSSSLDKIDNLENLELQDLSNQLPKDRDSQVDNENTYQPLIPPRSLNNTGEYQSLTQLRQHQDIQMKV